MKNQTPEQIVKKLVEDFRARKGVFQNRINVEDWVPDWANKKEKANFLFLVTVLDYGMRSTILYQGANDLFKERRNLLDPKALSKTGEKELAKLLLQFLHVRFPNEAAKKWITNSQKLMAEFNGDVFKIFNKPSAVAVLENIYQFRGFGKKTGDLLFRSTVNTFELSYPDIDNVPMPIDRHKLRLTYEWEFISKDEYNRKDRQRVDRIWKSACQKAGISWLEFDRAFWIWGVYN